jgi:hypothetical protein
MYKIFIEIHIEKGTKFRISNLKNQTKITSYLHNWIMASLDRHINDTEGSVGQRLGQVFCFNFNDSPSSFELELACSRFFLLFEMNKVLDHIL